MNSIQEANVRLEKHQECTAEIVALNMAGMTLQLSGASDSTNFMWVRFEIPNNGGSCTALCEVIERSGTRIRVRFKHLFPNERRALQNAIGEEVEAPETLEANVA